MNHTVNLHIQATSKQSGISTKGGLSIYRKGYPDPIATLRKDGSILRAPYPAEWLLDQIRRGIATGDQLICVDGRKRVDLESMLSKLDIGKSRGRRITPDKKAKIIEQDNRGFKIRQISERLGLSRSTVGRVVKQGVSDD